MIIFSLLFNVLKSQCIDASCHYALCCVIIMNFMIDMYCKQGWEFLKNYMNKRLPRFWVFGYLMVVINVSKNINSLFMGEYILIFFKLTPTIHFLSLFNCKASIVICHMFF
jgi:hypothetical protein